MDWLPGQARNPLGMTPHGVANGLSRLRIPHTDLSIMSTGSKSPLSCLPLDAEDPPLMAREHMRGGFGAEVP